MQCFRVVYKENTSDEWDILWYTTRKPCITILYRVIENTFYYIQSNPAIQPPRYYDLFFVA